MSSPESHLPERVLPVELKEILGTLAIERGLDPSQAERDTLKLREYLDGATETPS